MTTDNDKITLGSGATIELTTEAAQLREECERLRSALREINKRVQFEANLPRAVMDWEAVGADVGCFARAALSAPAPANQGGKMSEWISVKERLPEKDRTVQLYDGREQWFGCLNEEIGLVCYFGTGVKTGKAFTHWMPLPAPPQTGEE